jgi:hypothetical protein
VKEKENNFNEAKDSENNEVDDDQHRQCVVALSQRYPFLELFLGIGGHNSHCL